MKILFTAEYDEKYLDEIKSLGEVEIKGWALGEAKLTEDELIQLGKDKDVIITSYDDITKNVIDACANLKLIACTRATPVNVDTAYAKSKGIKVLYTPGRNSDSTAEHTIALILAVARNIPQAHMALKQGKFTGDTSEKDAAKTGLKDDVIWGMDADSPYVVFKGMELKDKTLGIIGYGSIGKRVGEIAHAFGMNLLIYDPFVSDVDVNRLGRTKVSLDDLLRNSDVVTVHLKVTEDTKGIINREAFVKMKKSAFFINCARAAVVDESALIDALRNRTISGAALDVYSKEPLYKSHPFITEFDNVVITPHIAGATHDILGNHTKMIIADIKRYKNDEHLLYEYK